MKHDPFHSQRETKSRHRRAMLTILKVHPSTFSELLDGTKLSRPVLTDHLKELIGNKIIERQISGEKTVYQLTQRGKAAELVRTRTLASGFQAATALIRNSVMAEKFVDMAKLSKDNPDMFQVLMDWMLDLSLFMNSDPFFETKWLRILGGSKEEWRPISEAIKRKVAVSTIPINTPEEFREALDQISATIKKTLQELKETGKSS